MNLDIIRVGFCIPFLFYACISDLKTRRVSNMVWLIMAAGSIIFMISDLLSKGIPSLFPFLFSSAFMFVFAYAIFKAGLFGGADAKCLIVLSMTIPTYPHFSMGEMEFPLKIPLFPVFSFVALGNGVILSAFLPFLLFFYNIFHFRTVKAKNPLYLFIGYPLPVSKLRGKKVNLLDGSFGRIPLDEEKIRKLEEEGIKKVWVTPALPFMIPITVGFFTAVFYGDIISSLIAPGLPLNTP
ncbi:MAG: A24 family peptidase [Candidatus Syntropharchaeia archaeon]